MSVNTAIPRALLLASFGGGFCVMGSEVAAGRLLAPYFGTSTPVWSALIGTVLGALALGAHLGGRLSQRKDFAPKVFFAMGVAGALLFALPAATRPIMRGTMGWFMSGAMGALALGALVVFAAIATPVVLLGMLSPALVQYASKDVKQVGTVAGKLGAYGTIGSLAGTFACGIVLVPCLGTDFTFRACGAIALVLGAVGWVLLRERKAAPATRSWVTAAAAVLFVLGAALGLPSQAVHAGTSVHERETPYNYLRVEDRGDRRMLYLNEGFATQTIMYQDHRPYLEGVWGHYASAVGLPAKPPSRILVVGLGGGASASYYARRLPDAEVVAIELDPGVVDVARTYFDVPARVDVRVGDARTQLLADKSRYDLVVVDAFQFPYVPFQLTTQEFFRELERHMSPGAALMMNVGRKNRELGVVHAVAATLETVFPRVYGTNVSATTTSMLVASDHPLEQGCGLAAAGIPQAEIDHLQQLDRLHRWEVPQDERTVLTDDRAPVEWLTNQVIVRELRRMLVPAARSL